MKHLACLAVLLTAFQPVDTSSWKETDWSRHLAEKMGGVAEYRLPDESRIDVFDEDAGVAFEVEWASKWTQAIGQCEFYAISTGAKPGVILLLKDDGDKLHYLRCLVVCEKLGIELRTVDTRKPISE